MKKLLGLIAIVMMFSCSSHQGLTTAKKHQVNSVKLNKKQARGLKKASEIVNARLSEKGY
jgi:hypothetical protein